MFTSATDHCCQVGAQILDSLASASEFRGNLFRLESGVALAVAVYVVLRGSQPASAAGAVVAASALGAVVHQEALWFTKRP